MAIFSEEDMFPTLFLNPAEQIARDKPTQLTNLLFLLIFFFFLSTLAEQIDRKTSDTIIFFCQWQFSITQTQPAIIDHYKFATAHNTF